MLRWDLAHYFGSGGDNTFVSDEIIKHKLDSDRRESYEAGRELFYDLWSDNTDMCNFHLSSVLMTPRAAARWDPERKLKCEGKRGMREAFCVEIYRKLDEKKTLSI